MALELMCKINVGMHFYLATKRFKMQMDHVRWDVPWIVGDSRSRIILKLLSFFGFLKGFS